MGRWMATQEESEHYHFLFQRPVYVHNQLYKCRLLITFENSSDPKSSCNNARMCSLVSAGLIIIVVLN